MSSYILETLEIEFTYPDGTKALDGLSMAIPEGKKTAVLGRNGSGKSTLFLHFNGVNRPDKGTVLFRGDPLCYSGDQLRELRRSVGMVFQDPDNQLFSANVYQDVSFGPLNMGWPDKKVREKVEYALNRTGMWEYRDKPVHFLSQGQKKRTAIAGVLAMEPRALILDEPAGGLDPYYRAQITELLNELNEEGAAIIISSHDVDEVFSWADIVFIIHEGRIIAQGKPEEVFMDEEILKKANLVKPWALEVYTELPERLRSYCAQIPKTRADILKILKNIG